MIVGPQSTHLFLWQRMYEERGNEVEVVTIGSHDAEFYKNQSKINLRKASILTLLLFFISNPWLIISGFINARKEIPHYFAYKYYSKLLQVEIKRFRPDVIHAHFLTSGGFITMETGFQPFFVSVWGSDVYLNLAKREKTKWLKDLITRTSFIHAQTNRQKTHLEKYGFINVEILVANWGVESQISSRETVRKLKHRFHLNKESIVISCPRRLDDNLNAKLLFKTAVELATANSNIFFIFSSIGIHYKELKAKTEKLGLCSQILFPGFLPYEEFLGLFAIANYYLQAPKSDGVALTLMNAMMNKLPILTTEAGDVLENIQNKKTGLIIEPSVDDIIEKIKYLMDHPEIGRQLGKNAYKWAIGKCNREINFQKVYSKMSEL